MKSCENQVQVENMKDFLQKDYNDAFEYFRNEIDRLERIIDTTNQYNRRENLIIDRIPDHLPQEDLENVCREIIHQVGFVPISNYDVVSCHRLRKKGNTSPTIIRFVNRKVPEYLKKNKWRLRNLNFYNWNLSFREDLCESNQAILAKCEELKAAGHLK